MREPRSSWQAHNDIEQGLSRVTIRHAAQQAPVTRKSSPVLVFLCVALMACIGAAIGTAF